MTFEKAISRIEDEFEEAKKLPFIRNPLAYAIYQVWKMADMDGKKIEYDCFSLPTTEVHNMTEKDLEIQNLRREIAELREQIKAQEWISVDARLPETIPVSGCDAEYSEAVTLLTEGKKVFTGVLTRKNYGTFWLCDADYWEAEDEKITHWKSVLPLPKETKKVISDESKT